MGCVEEKWGISFKHPNLSTDCCNAAFIGDVVTQEDKKTYSKPDKNIQSPPPLVINGTPPSTAPLATTELMQKWEKLTDLSDASTLISVKPIAGTLSDPNRPDLGERFNGFTFAVIEKSSQETFDNYILNIVNQITTDGHNYLQNSGLGYGYDGKFTIKTTKIPLSDGRQGVYLEHGGVSADIFFLPNRYYVPFKDSSHVLAIYVFERQRGGYEQTFRQILKTVMLP